MKNFFLFLLILTISLTSCSQNYDEAYSCNEQVDRIVKSNLSKIHLMTRSEWKKLGTDLNVAVFRAFTPEQKVKFWKEKFAEVKALGWSNAEMKHIIKAEQFVDAHSTMFKSFPVSDEVLDEIETFFYKWTNDAKEKFGWDKKIAYSIAATGLAVKNRNGDLIVPSKNRGNPSLINLSLDSECHCNTTSSISCFPNTLFCEKSTCRETSSGCGWVWVSECDGLCGGI